MVLDVTSRFTFAMKSLRSDNPQNYVVPTTSNGERAVPFLQAEARAWTSEDPEAMNETRGSKPEDNSADKDEGCYRRYGTSGSKMVS